MSYQRPPRGYSIQESPLPHTFEYQFALDMEANALQSTMITLFRAQELAGVEAIEVNPAHPSFAEDTGSACFMGSIVPRVSVQIFAKMSQTAFEIDAIEHMKFKWMPIYISFLNSLDAENSGSPASDIETILELTHNIDNKDTHPLYNGSNEVGNNLHPLSTVPYAEAFGDVGLAGDAKLEYVGFDENAFWEAKRFYTNKGMLNKVTGSMHTVSLDYHRRPYFFSSNNFTQPAVKRMNPYTFCGILFTCPQTGTLGQYATTGDVSTSVAHVDIGVRVSFPEWNPDFDQTSI